MKYGFIGCGNMGGALAEAASRSIGEGELLLADQDLEKAYAGSTDRRQSGFQ